MRNKRSPLLWIIPALLAAVVAVLLPQLRTKGSRPALGEPLPDFTVTDSQGRRFTLSEEYARGPVILVFYRGYFCGICQNQLQELEQMRPQFEELGAQLVAISTDGPAYAERARVNLGLGFRVIPDNDLKLLKMFDHKERSGEGANIHNPAVYIVDTDGIVRYAYFGSDAADRPSAESVYEALAAIVRGDYERASALSSPVNPGA